MLHRYQVHTDGVLARDNAVDALFNFHTPQYVVLLGAIDVIPLDREKTLWCFRGLCSLRIPFSRRKQSELETLFAAALFFQVPRARLQQIVERHQT